MSVEENYIKFKELLSSVNREGIGDLIAYLDTTDFKLAPASTKYHGSCPGGLCAHSLAVYDTLVKIITSLGVTEYDQDTLKIVALLHDISKINSYEQSIRNEKVYKQNGSKYDELGNYDWESKKCYKLKEDRFVFVNHESTSEFIIRQFIQLKIEESIAIMTHHGGFDQTSLNPQTVGNIYAGHPLAIYLHVADLITAYTIC